MLSKYTILLCFDEKKNMEHSLNDVASVKSSQNGDHHPKILAKKTRSVRSRSSNRASKNVILHQPYHSQEHGHDIRDISNYIEL